ncbi:MAG: dihydrolipoyl dehydrogenase [Gammaproteobacteria bacterium]|nr:dihydrolipoyl dehydrogenase [Gammaproteobacteria bacterium]
MADYQVLVIGAGPGGYVAAIRAAQLGASCAIIEAEEPGGVCLNWGCIPTKTLLHSADLFRQAKTADAFGIELNGTPKFNLDKAVERSRTVAGQLNRGVRGLLRKHQIPLITGKACLLGQGRVAVTQASGEKTLSADAIILATGARPRELPGLKPDGTHLWTAREAMTPNALPERLAVIGGGAIGVEFASFYATIGCHVTVIEMAERILPTEDAEISTLLAEHLTAEGIQFHTSTRVSGCEREGEGVTLSLSGPEEATTSLTVDRAIIAAGITGNVDGLGLEHTAVEVKDGHIVTDAHAATAEPGVYAIGDVAGAPWLAHKASHEAIACVERLLGNEQAHLPGPEQIPSCTYCHPQVASIGLTEQAATERGYQIRVGRFPLIGNGKAQALGETEGLIKTIFDEQTGALLGAHLLGSQVTELISTYAVSQVLETTEAELLQTVFPHPTLSEALHESVLAAWDRGLHL